MDDLWLVIGGAHIMGGEMKVSLATLKTKAKTPTAKMRKPILSFVLALMFDDMQIPQVLRSSINTRFSSAPAGLPGYGWGEPTHKTENCQSSETTPKTRTRSAQPSGA
jgi:hypothetical protein